MDRITPAEYYRQHKGGNKYNAKRTEYNGYWFDSMAEAKRAQEIDWLIEAGEVSSVEYQPPFPCVVEGVKVCTYVADFKVTYPDSHVEIEDVKGVRTAIYKLKKKLVEALYGIHIIEL